jgi:hypothetical protein
MPLQLGDRFELPAPREHALYTELSGFLRQRRRSGGEITRMMAQT